MNCQNCGRPLMENSNFCEGCNTPTNNTVVVKAAPSQGPQPAAPATTATPVSPTVTDPYGKLLGDDEMTVNAWLMTMVITGLPVIGLIMLFVWGFGSETPLVKRNYCKAMLIVYAIWLAVIIFLIVFFAINIANAVNA